MEAEPLDPKELHAFTDSMLPGCFHLLDELPDTVYRLCDLLMTAIKRNGPEYRDLILGQVVHQVSGQSITVVINLLDILRVCLNSVDGRENISKSIFASDCDLCRCGRQQMC